MKRTLLFGTLILCAMMLCTTETTAQTKKQKKTKKAEIEQRERQLDSLRNEVYKPADLPCYNESKDDADYFKLLGIGEDFELGIARQKSLLKAKNELYERLQNYAAIIIDDFFTDEKVDKTNLSKQDLQDKCLSKIGVLIGIVKNGCEYVSIEMTGARVVYCAIQLEKKQVANAFISAAVSAGCDEEAFMLLVNRFFGL